MVFKGAVSNSTIDFGADNDTLTFSVAATSATILGGSGADTLIFSSGANLVKSSVSGGADGDSLYFSAGTQTSASIAGGGGNDTFVFGDTVGGTLFVSLDSGADSVSFVTKVAGATMLGGNEFKTVLFGGAADLAIFSGGFGGGFISLVQVTTPSPSLVLQ